MRQKVGIEARVGGVLAARRRRAHGLVFHPIRFGYRGARASAARLSAQRGPKEGHTPKGRRRQSSERLNRKRELIASAWLACFTDSAFPKVCAIGSMARRRTLEPMFTISEGANVSRKTRARKPTHRSQLCQGKIFFPKGRHQFLFLPLAHQPAPLPKVTVEADA